MASVEHVSMFRSAAIQPESYSKRRFDLAKAEWSVYHTSQSKVGLQS
jgi:hypothetical protein